MSNLGIWDDYFKKIRDIGLAESTEHTFRTDFENLLNSILPDENIKVIHEPKREKGFGSPDFRIEQDGANIGYIETKPLDENLDKVLKSKQIKKYLSLTNNLILTNYHEFIHIKDAKEIFGRTNLFYTTDLESRKTKIKDENAKATNNLLDKFFLTDPLQISNSEELAIHMANRAKYVKEFINEILDSNGKDNFSKKIQGLYDVFKKTLVEDLEKGEFADAYAQTVVYGFFLAYLQSGKKITVLEASRFIPSSFQVIKEFFDVINDYTMPSHMKWIFGEIVSLINNVDLEGIYKSISFKNPKDKDPYLYFYETFLREFDPKKKKSKGVYYTPISVVGFITRSIGRILNNQFNKANGFADPSVTVLDFAAGTGTFLVSIFEQIFDRLKNDKGSIKGIVRDHLLKNFYGFEYLVAPYAVAHLKLSQLLKDNDYVLGEEERLQIYLTDTLDDSKHEQELHMPALSVEGEEATEIKIKKEILVITGNPPYNVKSRNNKKWIRSLIDIYKPQDEKKLNIDDDYIKFIRYAHWKMQQTSQGIVGIITNNSFLKGITHRKLRGSLLRDFDEIYILNLHGSSRIVETTPNGTDENVFDIQQGVSINIFVKKEKRDSKCSVYYSDLFGTRETKDNFLMENDIDTVDWEKLNYEKFNNEFRMTNWGRDRFVDELNFFVPMSDSSVIRDYGNYWGITQIFNVFGSGVKTDRDDLLIDFNEKSLTEKLEKAFSGNYDSSFKDKLNINNSSSYRIVDKLNEQEFEEQNIQEMDYRPFDMRRIYYKVGFTSRPAFETVRHLISRNNKGIVFKRSRYLKPTEFRHIFAIENIVDINFLDDQTYVAPLYLFQDDTINNNLFDKDQGLDRVPNFTPKFQKFISAKYSFTPSPEEILGYIYAILYSPSYRDRYLEYLMIDFPRVPFVDDKEKFLGLSSLGMELIDHHLMKKSYSDNKVTFPEPGDDIVEKADFKKNKDDSDGKIWINKKQYFDNMPIDVWEFFVGGYQVLDKWLKSRKGRQLSYSEQETFKKIANTLQFTIKQMDRIDEVVKDVI